MPDLRSKYAIQVDGETVGELETFDEALVALECLRGHDVTVEGARKILASAELRTTR
jgi:hypothetical protein